jgi:hypothetical protein
MSPFDLLSDRIAKTLLADLQPVPLIIFCDHDENGHFQRFGGLERAREALERIHTQTGGQPSILMLGLFPLGNGANRKEKELMAMLQWPGIRYLPFGFTKDELIFAARSAFEGAKIPPPAALLAKPKDIVRIAREVSHWLENRLRNTEGALIDFRNAASATTSLHPAHLDPMGAISRAHRQVLDRLWALEPAAERLAPRGRGLALLKAGLADFEDRWRELETIRAAIRSAEADARAELLSQGGRKLERVHAALSAAVAATAQLRREMTEAEQGR